jgi:hypothetical protein
LKRSTKQNAKIHIEYSSRQNNRLTPSTTGITFNDKAEHDEWIGLVKKHNGGTLPKHMKESLVYPKKPYHYQGIPDSRERLSDVELHKRVQSNRN